MLICIEPIELVIYRGASGPPIPSGSVYLVLKSRSIKILIKWEFFCVISYFFLNNILISDFLLHVGTYQYIF